MRTSVDEGARLPVRCSPDNTEDAVAGVADECAEAGAGGQMTPAMQIKPKSHAQKQDEAARIKVNERATEGRTRLRIQGQAIDIWLDFLKRTAEDDAEITKSIGA